MTKWEPAPLKRFLWLNDSGTWGDDPKRGESTPVIRSTEIRRDGSWSLVDVALRSISDAEKRDKTLEIGDLVVVKSSGSPAHLGKTAIVTEEVAAQRPCFANFVQRLRPTAEADSRYVWYLLNSQRASAEMEALGSTTTGLRNLNGEIIGSVTFPGPPLIEQLTIADFLDAETARIDAVIAKEHQLIRLLDARFVATVDERTKGLTPTPLRRVAEVTYGLGQPPPLSDDGVPILRATNVNRGVIESTDLIRSRLIDLPLGRAPLLEDGDIIVVRSGANTGDSALITGEWVGAAPGYDLRVRPTTVDPSFLAAQMLGRRFLDQVDLVKGRAAQPHLNAEELGNATVMVASSSSAERSIGRALIRLDECRRGVQQRLTRQIDLLVERRQALITAAVTGELEITRSMAEEAS